MHRYMDTLIIDTQIQRYTDTKIHRYMHTLINTIQAHCHKKYNTINNIVNISLCRPEADPSPYFVGVAFYATCAELESMTSMLTNVKTQNNVHVKHHAALSNVLIFGVSHLPCISNSYQLVIIQRSA